MHPTHKHKQQPPRHWGIGGAIGKATHHVFAGKHHQVVVRYACDIHCDSWESSETYATSKWDTATSWWPLQQAHTVLTSGLVFETIFELYFRVIYYSPHNYNLNRDFSTLLEWILRWGVVFCVLSICLVRLQIFHASHRFGYPFRMAIGSQYRFGTILSIDVIDQLMRVQWQFWWKFSLALRWFPLRATGHSTPLW